MHARLARDWGFRFPGIDVPLHLSLSIAPIENNPLGRLCMLPGLICELIKRAYFGYSTHYAYGVVKCI